MATVPFPWTDFNGLDLRAEADSTGGALDLLNADLDKPNAVRTRSGFTHLNGTANPVSFASGPIVPGNGAVGPFLSGTDRKIYAYDYTGTLGGTSADYGDKIVSAVRFGTGTTSYVYFGFENGAANVRMTLGYVFSSPAGMPAGKYLAVQPNDNRLVAGCTTANPSRVWFSDPGDAETFGANNYVDLTPNDGELITGVATWRNFTFVFKITKFFVFYGNDVDGSGNPVFNYRAVDSGLGVSSLASSAIPSPISAPDGVYFVSREGVHRTTGGDAQTISAPIDPLFSGASTPYGTLTPPLGQAVPTGTYLDGRVYLLDKDNAGVGSQYVLVYDIASGEWLPWQFGLTLTPGLATLPISTTTQRLCFASGTRIYTRALSDTTDDGAGITARWRSPFTYPAVSRQGGRAVQVPDQEVIVRESILNGVGTLGFSMASNWATALPTSGGGAKQTVKLGATVPKEGRHRKSQRGRTMSFQIETPTASDDFSSNTIANYTADVGATTNLQATGGVLKGLANLTAQTRLFLTTGTFTDFGDCVVTVKVTVGGTLTNFIGGALFKRINSLNCLAARISDSGSASTLTIAKNVAGVTTDVATQSITRLTTTTAYWLRVRIEGNVITAEHFTSNPASAVAAASTTYTLAGSEATTFGSGVVGKAGLSLAPQHASASLDDFSVVGGAWKVEDVTMQLTGFRAPALQTA